MTSGSPTIPVMDMAADEASTRQQFGNVLGRLAEAWRKARAGRIARDSLAELDTTTLRDIGLDADEVVRAHSGEDFTPRSWA